MTTSVRPTPVARILMRASPASGTRRSFSMTFRTSGEPFFVIITLLYFIDLFSPILPILSILLNLLSSRQILPSAPSSLPHSFFTWGFDAMRAQPGYTVFVVSHHHVRRQHSLADALLKRVGDSAVHPGRNRHGYEGRIQRAPVRQPEGAIGRPAYRIHTQLLAYPPHQGEQCSPCGSHSPYRHGQRV